jgi:hypothetical protein
MMVKHGFDALHLALAHDASRRGVLAAAGALALGLLRNDPRAALAKRRHKKKRRRKKKPHHPPPPCSGGACAAVPQWAGDQDQIDYCEFVCRQCDGGDPRAFCIVNDIVNGDAVSVAVCCTDHERCCVGTEGSACVPAGVDCCADDGEGFCLPGVETCCPGVGCVQGSECPDADCDHCPPGQACCNGSCYNPTVNQCCEDHGLCVHSDIDPRYACCPAPHYCTYLPSSREHCGACGNACLPFPGACCEGTCVDLSSDDHCGGCLNHCRSDETCTPIPGGSSFWCTPRE